MSQSFSFRKVRLVTSFSRWNYIWNESHIELRIWNQVNYGSRSFGRKFCNCVEKPEKFRSSTEFEPVTSRLRCDAPTNWAIKRLTSGAGHLWVLMFPWGMESMMKLYLKWIIYWIADMKSNKLWSSQLWTQILQLRRGAWKIQDFNGVWTRDLPTPVACSFQLSYEATDVGSWSSVGSNVPVRNESIMKLYIKWIIYWTADMKSSKLWSSQLWTQFLQLRRGAWKIQDFNGVSTRDLPTPVPCSNQLSNEATDVGSWSSVGSNVPLRNGSIMKLYMKWIIYWTADMKSNRQWSLQLWTQFLQLRGEAWEVQDFNGFWTRWNPEVFQASLRCCKKWL